MRSTAVDGGDRLVQHAVTGLRSVALTPVMQALTMLGSLPVVVGTALSGVLLLAVRTRSWAPPAVLAGTVASVAATVALVKLAIARPRPGPEGTIGPVALDFAFPSGHTGTGSSTWCTVVALVCLTVPHSARRTAALVGVLVLSSGIGLSRVYLGYHWPTDVVGGWLLAVCFTCAAIFVVGTLCTAPRARVEDGAPTVSGVEGQR